MTSKGLPIYNRPLARFDISDAVEALPDEVIEAGQLLRDDAAWSVSDHGKGLWVAKHEVAETELQLSGRKVKDYRCACVAFRQNEHCAHLAALLATVRLRKQPKAKAGPVRRKQTITTKRLVARLSEHELRDFVATYAKSHPDFALDLRVHFAQELPIANRFEQVITNLLRRSTATYGPKQAKRITAALHKFKQQRELWLADKAYLDLFELVTTLVPKLVVIIDKAERVGFDLADYIIECLEELKVVVASKPAPVILERIQSWTEAQLDIGAYYRNDLDVALHAILMDLGASLETTRKRLEEANEKFGVSETRVGAIIDSLYAEDNTAEADRILLDHLEHPEVVRAALAREVELGNYRRALRLANAALEQDASKAHRLTLLRFVVTASQHAQDYATLLTYAPELIIAEGSLQSIQASAEDLPEPERLRLGMTVLKSIEDSAMRLAEREKLRAEVLLLLEDFKALEETVYRSENAALIAELIPRLVSKLSGEDFQLLLETKVREHLQHRFGAAPAKYITQLLDAVARRSRTDVTSDLVERLRRDFRDRGALLTALDNARL